MNPKEEQPKIPPQAFSNVPPPFKLPPRKENKEQKIGAISFGGPLAVRGTSPAGVFGRLKMLRPRDIAFIATGLAILLAAPLAERFLSSPEEEVRLDEGFDRKGPLFPNGASVYEPGTGGFSPGSLVGQEPDVVTPLNVRDPSALVIGPGAAQMGAAGGTPLPAAGQTPAQPSSGWSDALAAAKAGAKEAAKTAKLPTPSPKLAGALRGLSALSGGAAGPTINLAPLAATHAPNKARESASLTRAQAAPGYRGAASRSTAQGSPEGLKNAGSRQADILNKGPAAGALEAAAKETMPAGGGASGGPGTRSTEGDANKNPANSSTKDSKSTGESLALLAAKLELEKSIDLKYAKRKYFELERQKFREETMFKTGAEMVKDFMGKAFLDPIGKQIASAISGDTTKNYVCLDKNFPNGIAYTGPGVVNGNFIRVGDKDTGQNIPCPGGIIEVGSNKQIAAASAQDSGQAGRTGTAPELIPGVAAESAAGNMQKELASFYGNHCKTQDGSKPKEEPYPESLCNEVLKLQQVVNGPAKNIADKIDEAGVNLQKAKIDMTAALQRLGSSVASLKATNEYLYGSGDGSVESILRHSTVDQAKEAYQYAMGTLDNTACGAKSGTIMDACKERDAAKAKIEEDVKKDLAEAQKAIESAKASKEIGNQDLEKIENDKFTLDARAASARTGQEGSVRALFKTLGEELDKTSANKQTADVVFDNNVQETYKSVAENEAGPFQKITGEGGVAVLAKEALNQPDKAKRDKLLDPLDDAGKAADDSIATARQSVSSAEQGVKTLPAGQGL